MSSLFIADLAITRGKQDVKRVLERQKMTEEAQTLQKFVHKKEELDEEINREIEELKAELRKAKNARVETEKERESKVRRAKMLQNQMLQKRNQCRC